MQPLPRPSIAWTDPPLEPEMPLIPIVSPKIDQAVSACITSESIVGVVTHYIGNRTKPCTGVPESCEGCLQGRPKRWKGYLAGVEHLHGKQVLVELTYEAYRGCKELHGIGAKLRGKKITLQRCGRARNGKVRATLADYQKEGDCPEPFDVQKALMRIWYGNPWKTGQKRAEAFDQTVKKLTHQVGMMPED